MSVSDKLPHGIRRLFRLPMTRKRRLRDLDEEIRFHIETHAEHLRSTGMTADAALAAALERFGDREDLRAYCATRSVRREPLRRLRQWFDEAEQDVRFAFRQVRRTPAVTATVVLILALGIGATTGVYSIVHHLFIDPLPFRDGNRMVTLNSMTGRGQVFVTPNRELLEAWRDRSRTVEQILIYGSGAKVTLGDSSLGPTEELTTAIVPPSLFPFLGQRPIRGRPIVAADTLGDAPPVALLAERVWRTRFGGADVLGTKILLDGIAHTVIGILPEDFFIPFSWSSTEEVVVPLRNGRSLAGATAIGKLRNGFAIEDANREVAALFPPESELNTYDEPARIVRQVDLVSRSRKRMILTLFGAVSLVLLIACANVANILMARAWSRQREFAVRTALGAGRRRIVRQVLTESFTLSLAAGALGFALAFLALDGIRAALPDGARDYSDVRLNSAVFLWSLALSAFTGLVFGLVPALTAANARAGESLKSGGRTAAGSTLARRVRTALVVAEVALSVVLLTGAGLLVRTLVALGRVDPGFQSHGLLTGRVRLTSQSLSDSTTQHAMLATALDAVRAIPGVRGALFVSVGPPELGLLMGGLEVEGRVTAAGDSLQTLALGMGPREMFEFTGIPIRRGRTFRERASSVPNNDEVIINESLARRLWPNGDALGARIRRRGEPFRTVVGIVGDIRLPGKTAANPRLNSDLQMYIERPLIQSRSTTLMVRSDLPVGGLTTAINAALYSVHPALKLANATTADAQIEQSFATQRFALNLLAAFAALAVMLAGVGLHAVMSYDIAQRTREIGVRIALGARSRDVTTLVLGQSLGVATLGLLIGLGTAVAATRGLRALLYGVEPGDPGTLAVVSILLLAIATVATIVPARRAAHLDPVEALRAD